MAFISNLRVHKYYDILYMFISLFPHFQGLMLATLLAIALCCPPKKCHLWTIEWWISFAVVFFSDNFAWCKNLGLQEGTLMGFLNDNMTVWQLIFELMVLLRWQAMWLYEYVWSSKVMVNVVYVVFFSWD